MAIFRQRPRSDDRSAVASDRDRVRSSIRKAFALTFAAVMTAGATAGVHPSPLADAQTTATGTNTTKRAFDNQGKELADGAQVNPGSEITYAISDKAAADSRGEAESTLRDTMSANQAYVQGSLKELNKPGSGINVTEPGTTDWSKGQDIATFSTKDIQGAKPNFGSNSQYAETEPHQTTTERVVSNGDGFNPMIAENAAGESFTWSMTHHTNSETLGCQFINSRENCSSGRDFWGPDYGTIQNPATASVGSKGYIPLLKTRGAGDGTSYYIGGVELSAAAPGQAPAKLGEPVQVLGLSLIHI